MPIPDSANFGASGFTFTMDGKFFSLQQAKDYLRIKGFSESDAIELLRSLASEANIQQEVN